MIGWASWWTWTPSATPLQPIKWNAHFWITFTLDDWPGWLMDSNPIHHPSPANKMKCSFLDYVQLLMISQAGWWTQTPFTTPLQPKKWNAYFCITFNFWCWPDWSMKSNPNYHPSPAKKMKCSFLDYIQLLMIGRAGWWTQTPSTTRLQPKKWNPHFCITLNFWWLAGLADGIKPHLPPLSSQKNEMLIFGLHSTSDDWPGYFMESNLIHHPSPARKMKCSFLDCIHFWWSAGLVDELEPHLPLLSCQKNEMLIFWLCSTSDDQPGWSMDSKPICHPSPAKKNEMLIFGLHSTSDDRPSKLRDSNPIHHPSPPQKMKSSFLDYVQLLMISQAGQWTRTPSTTPLQPKKMKCSFLDYVLFWWSAWLIDELEPHLPPLSYQKNERLNFWIRSTSDDQPGWLMNSNPICHPSPANKMKCSL